MNTVNIIDLPMKMKLTITPSLTGEAPKTLIIKAFERMLLCIFVIMRLLYGALVAMIFLSASCKKKEDNSPPKIVFNTPFDGSSFSVFDLIPLTANVSDDEKLEWVRIDVIDENNVQVIPTTTKSGFNSSNETIAVSIELDNIHIVSGTHWIRIIAFDGSNEFAAFRETFIHKVPLELEGIYTFALPMSNSIDIDLISPDFELTDAMSLSSDFSFVEANSYSKELLVLGSENSGATFLSPPQLDLISYIPVTGGLGDSYFQDLYFDYNIRRYFASTIDSQVIVYAPGGLQEMAFSTTASMRPHQLVYSDDLVIVEEASFDETSRNLSTYYRTSGTIASAVSISFDIVDFITSGQKIYLLGLENGDAGIYQFFPTGNSWSDLPGLEGTDIGNPADAVLVSSGDDSTVMAITGTNKTVLVNVSDIGVSSMMEWNDSGSQIEYDPVNGVLYLLSGTELKVLNPSSGEVELSLPLDVSVQSLAVLFNK
jgi:hypothetical protein